MTMTLTKSPRSARKAKGDGHLRRAEILHAAERIFVRDGYQGATIRKIAEEVGVSSTALYMHFSDKDEILLEICEGAIATLLASNTAISERSIDAVSRVRLMLDAYMRFGLDNPNTYQLAFCTTPGQISAIRHEATTGLGVRCYERFVGAVADIAAEGRLRVGDADSAAQTLWAACHGLVSLRTSQKIERADDETLMALMLDCLFEGLVID
ncbi:MAG TPA: TetR/AcrR family transcriptional regulator [Caulobacteraceae bacterium]|jgi:AcrR family transcriptional regulator|nr:TetR/AcrR family transcriptional regulator [Caulobacteraceae bacterium]